MPLPRRLYEALEDGGVQRPRTSSGAEGAHELASLIRDNGRRAGSQSLLLSSGVRRQVLPKRPESEGQGYPAQCQPALGAAFGMGSPLAAWMARGPVRSTSSTIIVPGPFSCGRPSVSSQTIGQTFG